MNSPTFTSTKPTCTLEVSATPSPLARWSDRPLVTDVAFRLTLEPPPAVLPPNSLPVSTATPIPPTITNLQGDGAQLQTLATVVETYVQKILAGGFTELATANRTELTAPEQSQPTPLSMLSEELAEPVNSPGPQDISLRPQSLVSHQLNLGSLQGETTGNTVTLTATQLFDLTAALTDWSQQMALLPSSVSSRGFQLPNLPIWAMSTAVAAAILGASTLALQWFQPGLQLGQVAPDTQTPATTAQAPAGVNQSEAPPMDSNSDVFSPEPLISPTGQTSSPNPTAKPSPGQPSQNLPPARQPSRTGSSPTVAPPIPSPTSSSPIRLPAPALTNSPPPMAYLPRGREVNPPAPQTRTARPAAPKPQPISPPQASAAPQPPVVFAPLPALEPPASPVAPPAELPPAAPAPQPAPLPESAPNPRARARPNSGNSADTQSSPRAAAAPGAITTQPPPAAPQPGLGAFAPPVTRTQASNLPQVKEVRDYFAQRWQPPTGLTQNLEYSLVLNADGSLQQVTPRNQAAKVFLDRTPMPLANNPFVSPMAKPTQLRLVLQQNGQVEVFLEVPGG